MHKSSNSKSTPPEIVVFSAHLPVEEKASFQKEFLDVVLPKMQRNDVAEYIYNMFINHQTHGDFILLSNGEYGQRNIERLILYYMFCENKLTVGGYNNKHSFLHHAELHLPDSVNPAFSVKRAIAQIAEQCGATYCKFEDEPPEVIKQRGTIYLDQQNFCNLPSFNDDEVKDLYSTIMAPEHSDCYKALWLDVATDSTTTLGGMVSKSSSKMLRKFQVADSLMKRKIIDQFLKITEFSFMAPILATHNIAYSPISSNAAASPLIVSLEPAANPHEKSDVTHPFSSATTPPSVETLLKDIEKIYLEPAANPHEKSDAISITHPFSSAARLPGGFLESTGMKSTKGEPIAVGPGKQESIPEEQKMTSKF